MKALATIGTAILIAGMLLAVCTADGSAHEAVLRLSGVVLTAIGAYILNAVDYSNGKTRE